MASSRSRQARKIARSKQESKRTKRRNGRALLGMVARGAGSFDPEEYSLVVDPEVRRDNTLKKRRPIRRY